MDLDFQTWTFRLGLSDLNFQTKTFGLGLLDLQSQNFQLRYNVFIFFTFTVSPFTLILMIEIAIINTCMKYFIFIGKIAFYIFFVGISRLYSCLAIDLRSYQSLNAII